MVVGGYTDEKEEADNIDDGRNTSIQMLKMMTIMKMMMMTVIKMVNTLDKMIVMTKDDGYDQGHRLFACRCSALLTRWTRSGMYTEL